MKYIMIIIILSLASFQVIAQQSSQLSFLNVSGSSLHNSDPLFIVSDHQTSREIAKEEVEKIERKNIQSISVLKDSKAIDAYGEKVRSGVIIIVLKGDSFSERFPEIQNLPGRSDCFLLECNTP